MTFKGVKGIPRKGHPAGRPPVWADGIREFMKSGVECVEVVVDDGNAKSAYAKLFRANSYMGKPVIVSMRSGKVFLSRRHD